MKKHNISYQLLKNYIAIFLITTVITILVIVALFSMNRLGSKDIIYNQLTAAKLMQNDYQRIDTSVINDVGGSLQVVNSNYEVIHSIGNNPFTSKQISVKEFTDFLMNTGANKDMITVEYNEQEHFWLIVFLPIQVKMTGSFHWNSDSPMQDHTLQMLGFIGLGYLLILILSTMIYAKITAVSFIKPLDQLSAAVEKVKNGDYSARVQVGGNREFSQLEQAFNHMAEVIQIQTSLKEQSENNRKNLILDISHDLKNPLTSIMGYAELELKEQVSGRIEHLEFAKIIYENSIRANVLIQDLFELSRMESPEFRLDVTTDDFSEYLREEMIHMLPELEAAGLIPDFVIESKEIILQFDKKRMNRVFSNLLYNAIAYQERGSKFQVVLEKVSDGAKLTFVNYGQPSALNPAGSGLGLLIVQKIITAHGGTVQLNTQDNQFEIIIGLNWKI
ncbi:HAMP domain-containing sensor histidine kinase [Paenibacillus sp. FSL R7-0189]|uniref:sensor histidine kinase n=1 Tax=Paenibacillus sp. FSL R7-0189 TaxID=2921673 RepID=UPI0030D7779D